RKSVSTIGWPTGRSGDSLSVGLPFTCRSSPFRIATLALSTVATTPYGRSSLVSNYRSGRWPHECHGAVRDDRPGAGGRRADDRDRAGHRRVHDERPVRVLR